MTHASRPGWARLSPVGTRILYVEDDERIRAAVKLALEDEGWQVDEAETGEDAIASLRTSAGRRRADRHHAAGHRRLRGVSVHPAPERRADHHGDRPGRHPRRGRRPRGGRRRLHDQAAPCPKELSARIRALLRRARPTTPGNPRLQFGDLEVVPQEGVVTRDGEPVHLTKTEFRLLVELANQPRNGLLP